MSNAKVRGILCHRTPDVVVEAATGPGVDLQGDGDLGVRGAGELLRQVDGGRAEAARELAYRLYMLCERKKWTKEALAYNALVVSWPEIVRLAAEE